MTKTLYELEFHFTSGARLRADVLEGRDSIDESVPGRYQVTIHESPTLSTLMTIHTEKLDAVQSTKRIISDDDNPSNV